MCMCWYALQRVGVLEVKEILSETKGILWIIIILVDIWLQDLHELALGILEWVT